MNGINTAERQTLMQAFDRLDDLCSRLNRAKLMTEELNNKLNRKNSIKNDVIGEVEVPVAQQNIVEMFNSVADKIEITINNIVENTERSMSMID